MVIDLNNLSLEEVQLLNDVSIEIKEDFHELLDVLYNDIDCNIDWLLNSVFSRNNYLSNVFLDLCYLELIKRTLKVRKVRKVIVGNRAQKLVFTDFCRNYKLDIIVHCHASLWSAIKNYSLPFRHILENILRSIQFLIYKDKKRLIRDFDTEGIIILDTFLMPSMISNGEYVDRYYNGLTENLPNKIKKRVYFAPILTHGINTSALKTMHELKNNQFIFNFDYLNLSDYLYAITSPLRILRKRLDHYYFHGYKITNILKNDIYRNIANPSSFQGILTYLFFRRLKLSKVRIELVIDWFENQVVDKGFNKGRSDYYPMTRSIGYEGYIVSNEFYFHHRPTEAEFRNGVIPDKIAVIGTGLCDDICKYYNPLPVITAPAFRYSKISSVSQTQQVHKKNRHIILAALPVNLNYAKDIICMLNDALRDEDNNIEKIIVNYHPALNINRLVYLIEDWIDKYDINDESFSSLIGKIDIVVSNSSSTCVESLAYGVPVIIIGSRNGITQNPIPDSLPKYMWEICYSVDEFNLALKRLVSTIDTKQKSKYDEIARDIRKNYFEPVTKEGVHRFLELKD